MNKYIQRGLCVEDEEEDEGDDSNTITNEFF